MELRLETLLNNLESIVKIQTLDNNNRLVMRISNTINAKLNVIVCSAQEPINMLLPLNVTWLNLDPVSSHYLKALVRTSKTVSTKYTHTWVEATTYAQVMVDQYYDPADRLLLGGSTNIGDATNTIKGIVKLSLAAETINDPIAVGDNDPRLSDARTPRDHSHTQVPASALKTATNTVTISTSVAPIAGQVLRATSPTQASWTTLTNADIH